MEICKSDSIVVFLNRNTRRSGNIMPEKQEYHIISTQKKDIYALFCKEIWLLFIKETVLSFSYFTQTWKSQSRWIKVRKVTRLSKCGTCERICLAIQEAISNGMPTDELKAEKDAQIQLVARE